MIPFSDGRRGLALLREGQERRQREFELQRALEAARLLQGRLELLLDHPDDVRYVRELRDRLAGEIGQTG